MPKLCQRARPCYKRLSFFEHAHSSTARAATTLKSLGLSMPKPCQRAHPCYKRLSILKRAHPSTACAATTSGTQSLGWPDRARQHARVEDQILPWAENPCILHFEWRLVLMLRWSHCHASSRARYSVTTQK
ncbi:hypothetical protein JCGZ_20089 [Jatropha curcas]|uniref:Uncharacterized protein n=1 Tax=Jatropha curcas TaxID=180498 RepID=A0A067JUB5_JATCU|nr:hypothetical protein JCGZ_20089 [Jatropha curcas]